MIFQLLTIIGLGGIFVVLMRRMPAQGSGFQVPRVNVSIRRLADQFSALKNLRLPKFKLPVLMIPKISAIQRSAPKPVRQVDPFKPTTSGNLVDQADEAFVNKDFISAERLYIQAATLQPQNDKIYARLGVIYLQQKNYKDARDALLSAMRFGSATGSRHYNLALAYQGMGVLKKALAEVKSALDFDPGNERYEALRKKLEG